MHCTVVQQICKHPHFIGKACKSTVAQLLYNVCIEFSKIGATRFKRSVKQHRIIGKTIQEIKRDESYFIILWSSVVPHGGTTRNVWQK